MRKVSLISTISHPLRKNIIEVLADAPRTVSEIVALTGRSQPAVSSNLAILMRANVVDSYPLGRERIYRLIPEGFEELVDWLDGIIHARDEKRHSAFSGKNRLITELHQARTCYDHLAGVEGVRMLDELLSRKWLLRESDESKTLTLTAEGEIGLASLGIELPLRKNSKRIFAYSCMDWTVKRFHLGGYLGLTMLKGLESLGYLRRIEGSRKVIMIQEVGDFFNGHPPTHIADTKKMPKQRRKPMATKEI